LLGDRDSNPNGLIQGQLLRRVVEALGGELEIRIKVPDETGTAGQDR
jgi:hypothetical protein